MTVEISDGWAIASGALIVIAIGTAFLRARKYIEDRVHESLARDEVIQRIALLVKPDMVFDEHGAVVTDRGACSLIAQNGIQIIRDGPYAKPSTQMPTKIKISFTKHLNAAPLLTSLNPESLFIRPTRGERHEWIYELQYASFTTDDDRPYTRQYRLEIQ